MMAFAQPDGGLHGAMMDGTLKCHRHSSATQTLLAR
jgi:hypothetical protein